MSQTTCVAAFPDQQGFLVGSIEGKVGVLHLDDSQQSKNFTFKCHRHGNEIYSVNSLNFHPELKAKNIPLENIRICYSPFLRTMQTAKMAASVLNIHLKAPNAREVFIGRHCIGNWQLPDQENYTEIWALDEKDPFMPPEGGETAADVASGLATALATTEAEFQGCGAVLVVSHGDPLQILQTILLAVNRSSESSAEYILSRIKGSIAKSVLLQHRKFALLTGELREIV